MTGSSREWANVLSDKFTYISNSLLITVFATPAASILCHRTCNRLGLKPCRAQKAFWHAFTSNPFFIFYIVFKLNALSSAGGLPSLFPLQVKVGLILRLCPLDFLVWCRCSKPLKYYVVRNTVLQIDFVTLWHELVVIKLFKHFLTTIQWNIK